MLHNLHLLRAIAALGVVYFHIASTAGLRLSWDVGSRGVDVFFVISGFIISYISAKRPEHFLRRRIIRIVPLYWVATLVVFAAAALAPRVFRSTSADVNHLIHSLLFIPQLNAGTGEMMPTLALGWSLNFEMYFYAVFALCLWTSRRWSTLLATGTIIAAMLLIRWSNTDNDVLQFYARPIVLEFCYGVLAYHIHAWCVARREALARHTTLKWLLWACILLAVVAIVGLERYFRDAAPRYLLAGIPAFFLVLGALLLESLYGTATRSRLVYWLGESSYIIYLLHPYIVFSVLRLFVKDADLSMPAIVALISGLLALTSALACAIHIWFERPAMALLQARWSPPAERSALSRAANT